MKIAFVIERASRYGAEQVAISHAISSAKAGNTVYLIALRDAWLDFEIPHPNIRIIELARPDDLTPSWFMCVVRLRRTLKELHPDHVIGFLTLTNIICLLSVIGLPIPITATEHGLPSPARRNYRALALLAKITYRNAGHVVCVSRSVADAVQTCFALQSHKVQVLANPVELLRDMELPIYDKQLSSEQIRVVMVGRLDANKRPDFGVQALCDSRLHNATLTLVGEGPLRPQLEALISDLGLFGRVHLRGYQSDIAAELDQATVLLQTSLKEGFGLVLIEAAAFGVPVVSTALGGPQELIPNTVPGIHVGPHATPNQIAEAILAVSNRTVTSGASLTPYTPKVAWEALAKILDA